MNCPVQPRPLRILGNSPFRPLGLPRLHHSAGRWRSARRPRAQGLGVRLRGEATRGGDKEDLASCPQVQSAVNLESQCARTDAFAAMPSKASCCDSRLLLLAFRVACNLGESLDVLQTGTLKELAETGQLGSLPAQLALQRLRDCILHPKQSSASADDGFGRPATKAVTSFRAERPRFHLVLGSDVVYDSYHGRQLALVFLRLRFMPCWDL